MLRSIRHLGYPEWGRAEIDGSATALNNGYQIGIGAKRSGAYRKSTRLAHETGHFL